jgi:hypothetical protein
MSSKKLMRSDERFFRPEVIANTASRRIGRDVDLLFPSYMSSASEHFIL